MGGLGFDKNIFAYSYSLAMETPSTERIRELSERLDSLRGELVSERTKAKVCPYLPNSRLATVDSVR